MAVMALRLGQLVKVIVEELISSCVEEVHLRGRPICVALSVVSASFEDTEVISC